MNIFGITKNEMENNSSIFTLNEIFQQPKTWLKTINQINNDKENIKAFINNVLNNQDFDIILTGAGTSEFIGNSLFSYLNKLCNYKVKSYASTDIVSTPKNYLSKTKPTLLISFGRSGNSPESIGAVNVANTVCDDIYHLFITCNKDGKLSKMAKSLNNCYAINLVDETHDQSFAMTSSFSNMYLAAYLCFNINNLDEKINVIKEISNVSENFLNNDYTIVSDIIKTYDFQRIVYLGSNTLKGIAQESALKMLELTSGKIVPMFDTPLGFRHGPKSIIDDTTLTVIYTSNDSYTFKYELDLIKEISCQRKDNKLLVISDKFNQELQHLADFYYCFNISQNLDNVEIGLAYITFAQVLAVLKSLSLNITPDNPCPSGEVNRVVQGVTLYNY